MIEIYFDYVKSFIERPDTISSLLLEFLAKVDLAHVFVVAQIVLTKLTLQVICILLLL